MESSFVAIRIVFWTLFALAVFVLPLNFGLGLITMGLFIVPILILHIEVGPGLSKIRGRKGLIVFSTLNLLVFSLLRPDGVHALTDNGLSALLRIFGIRAGYAREYENYLLFGSLVLLLIQLVVDLGLRRFGRLAS